MRGVESLGSEDSAYSRRLDSWTGDLLGCLVFDSRIGQVGQGFGEMDSSGSFRGAAE